MPRPNNTNNIIDFYDNDFKQSVKGYISSYDVLRNFKDYLNEDFRKDFYIKYKGIPTFLRLREITTLPCSQAPSEMIFSPIVSAVTPCFEEVVVCCDYQTTWEEQISDITYYLNGVETPMNLATGAYNPLIPADVLQLETDINLFMAANGFPDISSLTWDDSVVPEQLIIEGSCVVLVTKVGANPTLFTQFNCGSAECAEDLGISIQVTSNCLEAIKTGTSSETPLTDVLEYRVDGGPWLPYDDLNPPCDCEIMELLEVTATCQIAGSDLQFLMQVDDSCLLIKGVIPVADGANWTFGDGSGGSVTTQVNSFFVNGGDSASWDAHLNTVDINVFRNTSKGVLNLAFTFDVLTPIDCATVIPLTPVTLFDSILCAIDVRRTVTFPTCPTVEIIESI